MTSRITFDFIGCNFPAFGSIVSLPTCSLMFEPVNAFPFSGNDMANYKLHLILIRRETWCIACIGSLWILTSHIHHFAGPIQLSRVQCLIHLLVTAHFLSAFQSRLYRSRDDYNKRALTVSLTELTARNQHPRDGNRGTLLSSTISWGVLVYEARRQ